MKPIIYLALTIDDRPLVTTCPTLDAALDQASADLAWNILPIAFDIDGRWVAADQVLSLFNPRQERQVGEG